MDISVLLNRPVSLASRPILPDTLFQRLLQLGSIQASVISVNKGQAVLSSQLGQILAANSLDLKVGDRLLLRSNNNKQQPALKISQLPRQVSNQVSDQTASPISSQISSQIPRQVFGQVSSRIVSQASTQTTRIDITASPALARTLLPGKPVTAVVTGRNQSNTMVEIGGRQYKIQYQPDIKIGQLLSLTRKAEVNSIEVRPRDHLQVLKSAIARHLPLHADSKNPSPLVKLASLLDDIVLRNNQPRTTLEQLVRAMPELKKIDPTTIRQWVSYFVNPRKASAEKPQNPGAPFQLIELLAKSEPTLLLQIKEIVAQKNKKSPSNTIRTNKENIAVDLPSIVREVVKLGEQSLSHQLLQQSGVRLQQEQQQPMLLNLAIPVFDDEKLTTIGLKIRQHEPDSASRKKIWDIHLDFEIGSLGPVSTHLTISEETVSAIFWSEYTETQQNIANSIDEFESQITRAGFLPGIFHSFHGKPPQQRSENTSKTSEALLDIRV